MPVKKISIVVPCYNEQDNIAPLYIAVKAIFETELQDLDLEILFIDNCSSDATRAEIRKICEQDSNVKAIFNAANYGHIRSPFHGLINASGDAVMLLVADFQDPPELIPKFVKSWLGGYPVTIGVKKQSFESKTLFFIRKVYYQIVTKLSSVPLEKDFTGFGLYDRSVIERLREIKDPYPYLRGMIPEVELNINRINYKQPIRRKGITKNNFYTLFDMAMLGICSNSKVPLRLVTLSGALLGVISLIIGLIYLSAKLLFWDSFTLGVAPLLVGIFFFSSVQLFFLGFIGEYIGAVFTKVHGRPLVFEKERLNF